jgi:hypothetical protein
MGCSVSKTADGSIELDVGSIEFLLSPTNGLEIKSKVLNQLAGKISSYTTKSQAIINHLANQVAATTTTASTN